MISYHPGSIGAPVGTTFTAGFAIVETDDPTRIGRGISRYAWAPAAFKDGYRAKANFLRANWYALDFESPEFSLAEAVKLFCDMPHVIGTTRNHQVLKGGIKCDRFRVLLKAEREVTDLATYEWNLRRLARKYPVDPTCAEAGRHYFPCREIVVAADGDFLEPVEPCPPRDTLADEARRHFRKARYQKDGRLPQWLAQFLNTGRCGRVGRNQTVYAAAIELAQLGHSEAEAIDMIRRSPFDRQDFTDYELTRTVLSGFKRRL